MSVTPVNMVRVPTSSRGRRQFRIRTPRSSPHGAAARRCSRGPEVLAAITALRPAILVAGTHGKTTTSSMLAVLLDVAGLAPSFVIGSDVGYFGSGARWGDTDHFVVEADESDGTFLTLPGAAM